MKSLIAPVQELTQEGDDTVVFELEAPNADFPFILSDYHAIIMPTDKDGKVEVGKGIGTGGYVVKDFNPGVRGHFTRNPNYWKEGKANFDEVEALIILDAAARQAALIGGTVDTLDSVDLKTIGLLERAPDIDIVEIASTQHMNMLMRLDTPPFDNLDLRLAIKYAAKRQQMVDKVLLGHGVVGNDHDISPSQEFYNTEMEQREFDADKAKFHMQKSGIGNTELELFASAAALEGALDAYQLLQASCAEVGLNVKVTRSPTDGFWSNIWNKQGIGFLTSYWGGRPTNDWMFSTCCVEDSSWNDTAWKGTPAADRFNELVKAARSELDRDKRRQMYWEAQKLHNEDGGALIWGFTNLVHAVSKKIGHPEKIASNWQMDGARAAERWWTA